jgi:hypothetical protein
MKDAPPNEGKQAEHNRLFDIGIEVLRDKGWKVERAFGLKKASVRRITKDGQSQYVSIRTSRGGTKIAFPRNMRDDGWDTLSDVDWVLAVAVDDPKNPKFAKVHMIGADEMRERFDRAYKARKAAKHDIEKGRTMWLSLYDKDSDYPVTHAGAGAGLTNPPIAEVPLELSGAEAKKTGNDDKLTIAEAKRRLAKSFGVDPACIKITVEA